MRAHSPTPVFIRPKGDGRPVGPVESEEAFDMGVAGAADLNGDAGDGGADGIGTDAELPPSPSMERQHGRRRRRHGPPRWDLATGPV